MTPYDEGQVVAFQADVRAGYEKAKEPYDIHDDSHVVWVGRMQFRAVTDGYPNARAVVLAELYVQLGLMPDFKPAPRFWKANMCGSRIAALQPVSGGASGNPSLFLEWFYDRYDDEDRARARADHKQKGLTHWLLSWPDSRAFGRTPQQFKETVEELIADGFYPCVMWCSKDIDPHDVEQIKANIRPVIGLLQNILPLACVGWELSLWLSPTNVQDLIDWLYPQLTPWGCRLYVHFQQGYFAFQQPGGVTADFWKANVHKLTGVLHQRDLSWDAVMYQARIVDCLQRFAGGFGFPSDSGFDHPFDFVALEITAALQFDGKMSEGSGQAWGRTAIDSPQTQGPLGVVKVMGSGNGL